MLGGSRNTQVEEGGFVESIAKSLLVSAPFFPLGQQGNRVQD
jgi:hypothetical protein